MIFRASINDVMPDASELMGHASSQHCFIYGVLACVFFLLPAAI